MIMVYFDWDRLLMLKFTSFQKLVEAYKKKPRTEKRVVLVLECTSGLCADTIKTILDQSVRVHDIAIQTNHPDKINSEMADIATFHLPGSEYIREGEIDTVILHLENGVKYPYDAIENMVVAQ